MSEIIKAGKFSGRYTYLLTSDGRYSLIESSRIRCSQELVGRPVRREAGTSRLDTQPGSGMSFQLTAPRLLGFVAVLAVCSVALWPRMPSGVIIMWSLILHELGHIGIAFTQGSRDLTLGARLQYGLLPILYVSNRTIYERSRPQRIFYYSGGVLANLVLVAACFTTLHLVPDAVGTQQHLALAVHANAFLALINLYPLMFTDGFNILREILQVYDLRRLVMSHLIRPRDLLAASRVAFVYYVFVLVSLVLLLARMVVAVAALL